MNSEQTPPLSPPKLEWEHQWALNRDFGDGYFSREDGLAEADYVFLQGNQLAQRFANCQGFSIGELGFGSGLNMLLAWRLWRQVAQAQATLDLVTVEAEPMLPEQMRSVLQPWPELHQDLEQLIARLPPRQAGIHSIKLDKRVHLHLLYGDAKCMLDQWSTPLDAWFLDGFAPSRNSDMWTPELMRRLAHLTCDSGSFSTYTAAGHVRRSLMAAGFKLEKRAGFGRKREMLTGRLDRNSAPEKWLQWPKNKPSQKRSIAIIGDGLAGLTLAAELSTQAASVTLFGKGSGCSGKIPAMLVRPYAEKKTSISHRLYACAFEVASNFYSRHAAHAWHAGPLITPQGEQPGGHIETSKLLQCLREQARIDLRQQHVDAIEKQPSGWRLHLGQQEFERFDCVVLCHARLTDEQLSGTTITACAGQAIELAINTKQAFAGQVHVLPMQAGSLIGSSYRPGSDEEIALSADSQWLLEQAASDSATGAIDRPVSQTHVGVRYTSPDHLPLVGPAPDLRDWRSQQLKHEATRNRQLREHASYLDNLWLNVAHGSRAATMAPLAAQLLTAAISGRPLALEADLLDAISPGRFPTRQLKRKQALPILPAGPVLFRL